VSATLHLRVMVPQVWDEAALAVPPETTVSELKAQVLGRFRLGADPTAYEVKFRGAKLLDEGRTLADHGVVDNANLIVLSRRRQPVR